MAKFKEIKPRVHNWYLGKHVGFSSGNGLITPGHIERPFLAKAFDFVCREYKWIIGVLIALLMAYLAYHR